LDATPATRLSDRFIAACRADPGRGCDARWKSKRRAPPKPQLGALRFPESTIAPNCER
jgi:hypothetical protein